MKYFTELGKKKKSFTLLKQYFVDWLVDIFPRLWKNYPRNHFQSSLKCNNVYRSESELKRPLFPVSLCQWPTSAIFGSRRGRRQKNKSNSLKKEDFVQAQELTRRSKVAFKCYASLCGVSWGAGLGLLCEQIREKAVFTVAKFRSSEAKSPTQ